MNQGPGKPEGLLPQDEFGKRESLGWLWQLALPLTSILVLVLAFFLASDKPASEVIVYCAQDQGFAESVFQQFTRQTGIKVRAVYDSEAVKTVGLANRLIAEREHPQADLFWGNEEMRTRQLAAQGIFRQTNGWAAFGYRSRRMVVNTNFLGPAGLPGSILELTNAVFAGKVALAYPQFGTTATHFHGLRQLMGDASWQQWCRALAANRPFIVDGNSVVVKTVARGDAVIGLTDSDDIAAAQAENLPVAAASLTPEMLLIPNTVGVVRGGPHPAAAQRLFEYLQEPAVVQRLVAANALEGAKPCEVKVPTLQVNWEALLRDLEQTTAELNQIFLR